MPYRLRCPESLSARGCLQILSPDLVEASTFVRRAALHRAETLLSMKHGLVRLDNVWGVGGGLRPVKYLVRQMNLLLQEYLSSSDIHEATRCLVELEVPHFHHELVYEVLHNRLSLFLIVVIVQISYVQHFLELFHVYSFIQFNN